MKKLLFPLLLLFIISCNSAQNNDSTNALSGNISNLSDKTNLFLDVVSPNEITQKAITQIDKNGNFKFDFQIESEGVYRLRINQQNFITLILKPNENAIITGDVNNFASSSEESEQLKELNVQLQKKYVKIDSLSKLYNLTNNDSLTTYNLQLKLFSLKFDIENLYVKVIDKNPASLLSYSAVSQLNPDQYIDEYKKVDEGLGKEFPNSAYYKAFHQHFLLVNRLPIGKLAPDFTVPDRNGKDLTLSSLRGKIILLDFWASWCHPCRKENPNIVKSYQKFHDKGFDIFSVSLDGMPQQQNPKQDWLNAIAQDGLVWENQGCEFKGWSAESIKVYGVQAIPFNVLIDKEGKILGKNLRGEALYQKLAEIFKN